MLLKNRLLTILLLVVATLGIVSTVFWLSSVRSTGFAARNFVPLIFALAGTAALTTLSLGIRWLRWHFLVRRFAVRIPTRDSLRIYFVTLPAIATPFYLGELVRAPLLARRYPAASRAVVLVWLMERLTDAAVLLLFLQAAQGKWAFAALTVLVWLAVIAGIRFALGGSRRFLPALLAVLLICSVSAWLLPVAALWGTLWLLQSPAPFGVAAAAFSSGTLLGGITGIPLGTAITGPTAIVSLENSGLSREVASVVIAVSRAGTAWFALTLGLLALARWRAQIFDLLRPPRPVDHFDEIAGGYEQQIPTHIRERLLARKVAFMHRRLGEAGFSPDARGLDVGCGQGWYAVEMARLGYRMSAFDQARDQIKQAHRYAEERGAVLDLQVLDASRLPYADASFDFAYSVNVIHHIIDPETRYRAFQEIVRVLRPGGVFFLHEINTDNPLFRIYMGYVFPLLCDIDEGTEWWIRPSALPAIENAVWAPDADFFTFLPDFTPPKMLQALSGFEARLERSRLRRWSAHYVARLIKKGG